MFFSIINWSGIDGPVLEKDLFTLCFFLTYTSIPMSRSLSYYSVFGKKQQANHVCCWPFFLYFWSLPLCLWKLQIHMDVECNNLYTSYVFHEIFFPPSKAIFSHQVCNKIPPELMCKYELHRNRIIHFGKGDHWVYYLLFKEIKMKGLA